MIGGLLASGGVGVSLGAVVVLALGGAVAGASMPVLSTAQAEPKAKEARRLAQVALGLRVAGGLVALLAPVGLAAGLTCLAAGVAVTVLGLVVG